MFYKGLVYYDLVVNKLHISQNTFFFINVSFSLLPLVIPIQLLFLILMIY